MAAIQQYVHFKDSPPMTDTMCPKCFKPALRLYVLQRLDMDGITPLGERVACTDCKIWVSPIKEYAK